jgi:hypothetical protein
MTKNNHQNDLPCAFSETIVAVLYGEATTAERQEFRKHFNNCVSCREELISFGSVRDVVAEWRAIDFDLVKTPITVLPEIEKTFVRQTAKISWIERVRTYLLPNAGQMRGATAFAAFTVCALLLAVFGYTLINRLAVAEVNVADASKVDRPEPILTSPTPPPTVPVIATPQVDLKQPIENQATEVRTTSKPARAVVNSMRHQNKSGIPFPQHQPLKLVNKRDTTIRTAPKPAELAIESVDDLEDNSLRLSDLLDDVTPSM